MKKCPTCNRTFTDDALRFCLEDGSPLLSVGGASEPPSYDPGATMQYTPGRDTSPPPPPAYPPSQPQEYQASPPAWSPMPPAGGMQAAPVKKSSKAMYWIIGGIAAVLVLGIGGIILAVVLIGMSPSNTNNDNANNSNSTTNRNSNNANNSNANESNENTNTSPSKVFIAQDDFSVSTKWWVGTNAYGKAEYVNGEYQLSGTGGYVAVYGPKTYDTKNATTRVTTRSVTGVSPDNGYGLTVFSEMKNGQLEDYSLVIRTGASPAFAVYLHQGGKETTLVNWTDASQIRSGSATNQLEARATDTQIAFYINGQYATSVEDTAGFKGGVAGFYTSGTATIAYDDLEIFK